MSPCEELDELMEAEDVTLEATPDGTPEDSDAGLSRRAFLGWSSAVAAGAAIGLPLEAAAGEAVAASANQGKKAALTLKINGASRAVTVDTRTVLLDVLREDLDLTGTKKGCDHGQCGSCTVLVDGRRVNSCLTLAVAAEGAAITTIEGLGTPEALGPAQRAFLEHDGLQCGYCTPGQVCSATALVDEVKRGELSVVSWQEGTARAGVANGGAMKLDDREIRERMSGNICRCGAYPNIVAAVRALTMGGAA